MNMLFGPDGGGGDGVYRPIMPINSYHHHHVPSIQEVVVGDGGGSGSGGGGGDGGGSGGGGVDGLNMNMNITISDSGGGCGVGVGEPLKRKRGRPRKYSPPPPFPHHANHNNNISLNLTSPHSYNHHQQQQHESPSPSSSSTIKKPRGRPPGSSRKHQLSAAAAGSASVGFTAHLITIKAGEDVLSKIMSFSQIGPRGICILSANGAVSNATLRQAATSGGTVTYQGRFEILSLCGSFLLTESGGQHSRTGGLSISLAGPDGHVLGGGVAGVLMAASPVQVIVGSFISEDSKQSKMGINQSETMYARGLSVAGSPPSRGTFSESSGGPGSPPNQSTGGCNNSNAQGMTNLPWK